MHLLSLMAPLPLPGCGAPASAPREEALRAPSCLVVCPSGRPVVLALPRVIMEGAAASAEGLRYAEYARTPTGTGKGQAELDRGLVSAWRDPRPGRREAATAPFPPRAFTRAKGDVCERGGGRGCGDRLSPGWAGSLGAEGPWLGAAGAAAAWAAGGASRDGRGAPGARKCSWSQATT